MGRGELFMTEEKKKKISFDLTFYYPESMDNEAILDMFARQVIEAAPTISSEDIEIVNVDEADKMKAKEVLTIVEEIVGMIAVPNSRFADSMREYICEKLDISNDVLTDVLNALSSGSVSIVDKEDGKVNDNYLGGICPDCKEPIPDDIVDGQSCGNCGHVFYTGRK